MKQTVAFHTFGCKVNQYETGRAPRSASPGRFDIVPWIRALTLRSSIPAV